MFLYPLSRRSSNGSTTSGSSLDIQMIVANYSISLLSSEITRLAFVSLFLSFSIGKFSMHCFLMEL